MDTAGYSTEVHAGGAVERGFYDSEGFSAAEGLSEMLTKSLVNVVIGDGNSSAVRISNVP